MSHEKETPNRFDESHRFMRAYSVALFHWLRFDYKFAIVINEFPLFGLPGVFECVHAR